MRSSSLIEFINSFQTWEKYAILSRLYASSCKRNAIGKIPSKFLLASMWSYNLIMNKYSMLKHDQMPYRFLLYILSVSSSQNAFTECFWYRLESGSEHSKGPYLRDAKMFKKKLLEDINPIRKVEITRMLCNLLHTSPKWLKAPIIPPNKVA